MSTDVTVCPVWGGFVTPEEWELMQTLCKQIAVEKDSARFSKLVQELNKLLEKKEHRLKPDQPENPN